MSPATTPTPGRPAGPPSPLRSRGAGPRGRDLPGRPARLLVPGIPTSALIGAAALTCGVALTAASGWLIVAASFRPQILTLLAVIVLVRAFGVARPVLRYVERVRSHDAALAHLARERARVYERLIPLTPARLGRRSRGDVLAGVVEDLDDLAYAQVRVAVPIIALVGAGIAAALLDAIVLAPAALVVASTVICALGVGALDWWVERRTQAAVVAARARIGAWSTLVAAQGADLAAIGAAGDTAAWLSDAQDDLSAAVRRQAWGRALGVSLSPLVAGAHAVAMAFLVQPWVAAGLPTPLAALLVLTPVALGEVVSGVPDAVGALARAQGSAARLRGLLDQPPALADPGVEPDEAREAGAPSDPGMSTAKDRLLTTAPTPPELRARGIDAAWDDTRLAVRGADLDVAPGDFVAVVGPNGSGKSTLLAVLARHLDPLAGTYTLDGRDALAAPTSRTRSRLAVVDDETHVFASTLRENLRLARPGCPDASIVRALTTAGLGAWFEGLPGGLDIRLGADGRGVSGGERARLGLARAVLSGRGVLLLDEPVAHLDRPTALAVLADLRRASEGRSVVLVTHREEGLTDADALVDLGGPSAPRR